MNVDVVVGLIYCIVDVYVVLIFEMMVGVDQEVVEQVVWQVVVEGFGVVLVESIEFVVGLQECFFDFYCVNVGFDVEFLYVIWFVEDMMV